MANTDDEVVLRLRLKGLAQFIADVKSGKIAIEDLEKKVKKTSDTVGRTASPNGGFGLFSSFIKHLEFAVPMALGGAAAATAAYAVKSAASLEQVTVAFETMLGSGRAARQMIGNLQDFAQATPFNLAGIENTTQTLLGFGFSAKSIIPTLTALGNAASGLNIGQAGMDEISLALGQMRVKGRIQGDELMQLSEHHVNAYTYLEKALGLTGPQLQSAIHKNQIAAGKAIPIILAGMQHQFKGLMEKESHTLGGIWSNLHDAMQRVGISAVNPFMPTMKRWLQGTVDYLSGRKGEPGFYDRMATFMKVLPGNLAAGRTGFAAYNIGAILGTHNFDPAIEKAIKVIGNLGRIVRDVLIPAVKDFSVLLAPLVLLLEHLDSITGFIADHSDAFHKAVDGLFGVFLAYKGILFITNGVLKAYAFWTAMSELATVKFTKATNAQKVALAAYKFVVWAVTAAQWLWNAAWDASPIGATIMAIGLVATGFVIAYARIKPFRDFINGLWRDMKDFYKWIVNVWNPAQWSSHSGPTTQTINPNLVGGATNVPAQPGGSAAHPGPIIMAGAAAGGGSISRPGLTWVGERGPELLNLPRGSKVIPLPRGAAAPAAGGDIHTHVYLNGREIAEAVHKASDTMAARR